MNPNWPIADLDPVRRLRVLAAAIPGAVLTETDVPSGFEIAWARGADLETSMPRMIRDFAAVQITHPSSTTLRMDARGRLGQRARFDVELRTGWCWMQSRLWVGGIAATPVATGTRIGFLGGLRLPGAAAVERLLRPATRRMARQALSRLADDIACADNA